MVEALYREFVYLWYYFTIQFEQIFLYWVLGILIGSIISVFCKQKIHLIIASLQKRKLGAFGIVPASLVGIASPLCMYGTIPIAASFSEKGVKDDWLAAFMMASILLNPQLIIYSASLGTPTLIVRIATCFLTGVVAGIIIRFLYTNRGKSFFNFSGFSEPENRDTNPNLLIRLLMNIWRNIRATGVYFLIGIALSAVFQHYVPEEFVVKLFGGNSAFGVLIAATIGVPLYACGGGTIPLLQSLMLDGMSMGSATAFMITGPATKITNLGAMKIVLGLKRFIIYILFSIMIAFFFGTLIDVVF